MAILLLCRLRRHAGPRAARINLLQLTGHLQVTKGTGKVYGQLVPGNWFGDLIHMKAMVNVHATTEGAIVLISSEMVAAASERTKKQLNVTACVGPVHSEVKWENLQQLEFLAHTLGDGAFGTVCIQVDRCSGAEAS